MTFKTLAGFQYRVEALCVRFIVTDESTIQRRQHDRYTVSFPVSFSGEAAGHGQAMDLSVLGCAIDADQAAGAKTYLKLTLSLPDGEEPLEIDLAVVRWSHERKFGLEFIAFGETQKKRLMRFLNRTAETLVAQKGNQTA
ncbi:MAG: PilZ domain-containing protein [Nitrospira sp.]|nr:PilZ domain-containing protein [Nitrospira sp.]